MNKREIEGGFAAARTGASDESLTLVDVLRWRAGQQADRIAYTFLLNGEDERATVSYGELDRQACRIAERLEAKGATGQRVILAFPPGLEFLSALFGCLYAGATAVPLYPPNPSDLDRSLARLATIATDAQAQIVLTSEMLVKAIEALQLDPAYAHALDALSGHEWITWEDLIAERSNAPASDWHPSGVEGASVALLQYTSGSTGSPKGVILTHNHLIRQQRIIQNAFAVDHDSVCVSWLPVYHDMGLLACALAPPVTGVGCVLMSPLHFLQKPVRWLEAISRHRGTISGGPNFAYDVCVKKVTPEQRADLDLSSWRFAANGAEPVRAETIERFTETFAPCGFRPQTFFPCYGMAEATLMVSGPKPEGSKPLIERLDRDTLEQARVVRADRDAPERDTKTVVGCGRVAEGLRVLVVDPETRLVCGEDRVGEIWISGESVGSGYWNNPEETDFTFRARLSGSDRGPFLRTGDLGFLQDGQLFITGRLKDLIIVRGRNHYPQDVERSIEGCHPALRPGCGAVFSVEGERGDQVVVLQEIRNPAGCDLEEVATAIRRAVAINHELLLSDVLLLPPGAIFKTSSGKIQRRECRRAYLEGSLKPVAALPPAAAA